MYAVLYMVVILCVPTPQRAPAYICLDIQVPNIISKGKPFNSCKEYINIKMQ